MNRVTLPVQNPDGSRANREVRYWWEDRGAHVAVELPEQTIEDFDHDFWGALLKVRKKLEAKESALICNGTSIDVHPSGMCRDMGSGLSAYRLRLFRKPSRESLVKVFESEKWNRYSTLAAQTRRYARWLALPRFLPPKK